MSASESFLADSNSGDAAPRSPYSLLRRTRSASLWLLVARVAARGLALVRRVALARLLGPEDMGTIGVALLFLSMLEAASASGIDAALIHRGSSASRYFDTAQAVKAVRGLVIALVLWSAAAPVAAFFDQPRAAAIVRALALVSLLHGFTSVAMVDLQRELDFRRRFLYQVAIALVDLAVSVAAAVITRDPFAIVWGMVGGTLTGVVMSYLLHPYRPRVKFDLRQARELFGYGRWIFVSTILVFMITHGDDVIVGRVLGGAALGSYQLAYTLSNLPTTEMTSAVNAIAFPLFVKLKETPQRLCEVFLMSFEVSAAVTFGVSVLLISTGDDIIAVLLGDEWAQVSAPFKVLVVWGAVRALGASMSPVLQAVGRPALVSAFHALVAASTLIAIVPATRAYGLVGAAWAVTLPNLLVHWLRYPFAASAIGARPAQLLSGLAVPSAAAAVTFALVGATALLDPVSDLAPTWRLLVRAVIAATAFSASAWWVDLTRGARLRIAMQTLAKSGA